MQGRTGKQIRERFLNNLDPEINNEKFSEEEDLLILKQYRIFGPKWSEISKALQRRPVLNVFTIGKPSQESLLFLHQEDLLVEGQVRFLF